MSLAIGRCTFDRNGQLACCKMAILIESAYIHVHATRLRHASAATIAMHTTVRIDYTARGLCQTCAGMLLPFAGKYLGCAPSRASAAAVVHIAAAVAASMALVACTAWLGAAAGFLVLDALLPLRHAGGGPHACTIGNADKHTHTRIKVYSTTTRQLERRWLARACQCS
jgi:hypothetical protein